MEVDHEDNGTDIEAQRSSPLSMNGTELSNSSLIIMRRLAFIFLSIYKFIEAGASIASSLSPVSSSSSTSNTTFYTPHTSLNLEHGVCISSQPFNFICFRSIDSIFYIFKLDLINYIILYL
uniref:Autoinhibited calcium ATPase n=1 Tax=Solanum tuberosum TaxID=4113 RepID=M1AME1_SOLTU